MTVTRVKTTAGWEDLQKVGPQGPPGPAGTVYDTDQIGTIKAFAGTTIPTNWMLADGRSLLRAEYPQLADAMGISAGATNFNIPDLRNRFIYGASAPGVGASGGAATHALVTGEMPSHAHGGWITGNIIQPASGHYYGNTYNTYAGAAGYAAVDSWYSGSPVSQGVGSIPSEGGGGAHNNLPPYTLIAFIIKVTGAQINPGGALVGPAAPGAAIWEQQTPPSSPQVNDQWMYHPSTGVSWIFRYNPAQDATYPWQFVGGGSWLTNDTVTYANTAFAIWEHRNSPQYTLARAGVYRIDWGSNVTHNTSAWAKFHTGPGVSGGNPGVYAYAPAHYGAGGNASMVFSWNHTLAAGAVIRLMFYTHDAGGAAIANTNYFWTWIAFTPLRVA